MMFYFLSIDFARLICGDLFAIVCAIVCMAIIYQQTRALSTPFFQRKRKKFEKIPLMQKKHQRNFIFKYQTPNFSLTRSSILRMGSS